MLSRRVALILLICVPFAENRVHCPVQRKDLLLFELIGFISFLSCFRFYCSFFYNNNYDYHTVTAARCYH